MPGLLLGSGLPGQGLCASRQTALWRAGGPHGGPGGPPRGEPAAGRLDGGLRADRLCLPLRQGAARGSPALHRCWLGRTPVLGSACRVKGLAAGRGPAHGTTAGLDQVACRVPGRTRACAAGRPPRPERGPCAQGLCLSVPEMVPFRLTQNVIDGFGISGVEGVFRTSAETTLAVLREHRAAVVTCPAWPCLLLARAGAAASAAGPAPPAGLLWSAPPLSSARHAGSSAGLACHGSMPGAGHPRPQAHQPWLCWACAALLPLRRVPCTRMCAQMSVMETFVHDPTVDWATSSSSSLDRQEAGNPHAQDALHTLQGTSGPDLACNGPNCVLDGWHASDLHMHAGRLPPGTRTLCRPGAGRRPRSHLHGVVLPCRPFDGDAAGREEHPQPAHVCGGAGAAPHQGGHQQGEPGQHVRPYAVWRRRSSRHCPHCMRPQVHLVDALDLRDAVRAEAGCSAAAWPCRPGRQRLGAQSQQLLPVRLSCTMCATGSGQGPSLSAGGAGHASGDGRTQDRLAHCMAAKRIIRAVPEGAPS